MLPPSMKLIPSASSKLVQILLVYLKLPYNKDVTCGRGTDQNGQTFKLFAQTTHVNVAPWNFARVVLSWS